jgi:hypothetical protein
MPYEHRPNSGSLFKNRDRNNNERAPNLKGSGLIEIDGRTYELDLAAWTRESAKAGKWLSLSISLKQPRVASQKRPNAADLAAGVDVDAPQDQDSDIPF